MREDITVERLGDRSTILSSLLNNIFDGVYVVDKTKTIVFWNTGAREITGYSNDEVFGRKCSDNILNHIDDEGTLLCIHGCPLERTLATGEHVKVKIYTLHKSGRRFPVKTHIYPIRNLKNEIIAAIEVFRDISQEEEHRILQEKFSGIIKKYVSTTTFEEIMSKVQVGAADTSRKVDLTIMFLDVVGFTNYSEKYSPERVVSMLNELFEVCSGVIKDCQGDIDKFIGDAVMAMFLDANDAVRAASKILFQYLPELNERRLRQSEDAIGVRVGINSGPVIQGDIGTADRKDLTVIGDVVNTASRIEARAETGSLYISESTFSRLKDPSEFTSVGEIKLKGKVQALKLFKHRGR
ncbi:MAG: PAS domain S-box protein [Acidobacteriota bacterium]|nr:MAG: PAS domain S-box protein [Acidobacteriota bacterium]